MSTLQQRLAALGYFVGPADGQFGDLTTQAVYALQKAAHLDRDGIAGPVTAAALGGAVKPSPRTKSGDAIEVDLADQLVLVVTNGRMSAIFNASTGNGQLYTVDGVAAVADTPAGRFTVYRTVDGWDDSPLGQLWRPAYFNGGIALHGYTDVPPFPASHGCVRVSIAAMDWMWSNGMIPPGTPVVVY